MTLGMVYSKGFSKENFSEVNKEGGTLSARPKSIEGHNVKIKEKFLSMWTDVGLGPTGIAASLYDVTIAPTARYT